MTTGREHPRSRVAKGERATVLDNLANGMFRLQMTDGREVVAHPAQDLRMAFTRLLPGDQVLADVSPIDPRKARICGILECKHQSPQPNLPDPPKQRELS